jgi:glycosyltransferase involved in cell wall biosynthesis
LLSTSRQLITEQGFDALPAARNLPKMAVYCGFDPQRFWGVRGRARREICAEFNLRSKSKVMLFVGRLNSNANDAMNQKNPFFCLEVAKACAARNPDFVCLVAGGGEPTLHTLQKRVMGWGLGSRIRLLGVRSDVPRLMLGSDLLLLPSLGEGLGMVAVEAQAAGLPVIASDAVPRECMVVEEMVDFLPLHAGPERWADAVLEKVAVPKTDHRIANQRVVDSPFSIEHSAKRLIEIYQGAA